jgi:integrase/recombinase XerD
MMGLRISEATQLDIEHNLGVDGGYEIIHFIGKGAKPATMPMPVPVVRALHVVVGDRTRGPLLTTRTGERMDRACAARILQRLGRDIGLEKHITPHALRRTFITSGLLSGVPLRDMQAAARHSDPGMTVRYDMMANGYDRHAAHRVAGFLAGMAR